MKNIIEKSKKYVIGISYAIYLVLSYVYIAVWMKNVEIRVELWSEVATDVLTYLIFSTAVSIGFTFFTAIQQLTHSLLKKYPVKKPVMTLIFVFLGICEVFKILLSVAGLVLTVLYSNETPTTFLAVTFVCISLIFIIDVFYFVFEILRIKSQPKKTEAQLLFEKENDKPKSENSTIKPEKYIIGITYAIYLVALVVFTAKWSAGVRSHISMDEVSNAIFVFILHFLFLGGAFIFFTVMQALVYRLIIAYQHKRFVTIPIFILSAIFEVVKIALSLLAFIYVKNRPTKPMTPFSTVMIIFIALIFSTDVFYLIFEIIQTKRIRENYLDSLEETIA